MFLVSEISMVKVEFWKKITFHCLSFRIDEKACLWGFQSPSSYYLADMLCYHNDDMYIDKTRKTIDTLEVETK